MKFALKAGLTCLAMAALTAPVFGLRIAAPPIPLRVAGADVVVAGKVTKIENKTVSARPDPGEDNKVEYQIAVVKVADPILNAKGLKEIRVGIPLPAAGGGRPPIGGPRFKPVTLTEDEEVCLLLEKHPEGDFYIIPADFDAIKKANNTSFDKEVEEVKKAAKLLADPTASLKSKEANERFQTAAMLIVRYRTPKASADEPKEEPIDAAESKLILETLRDADWTPAKPAPGRFLIMTPLNSFFNLGLTEEDKWMPPEDGAEGKVAEAAKKWLKDNAGTYRIKKYVADKKAKEPEKKGSK